MAQVFVNPLGPRMGKGQVKLAHLTQWRPSKQLPETISIGSRQCPIYTYQQLQELSRDNLKQRALNLRDLAGDQVPPLQHSAPHNEVSIWIIQVQVKLPGHSPAPKECPIRHQLSSSIRLCLRRPWVSLSRLRILGCLLNPPHWCTTSARRSTCDSPRRGSPCRRQMGRQQGGIHSRPQSQGRHRLRFYSVSRQLRHIMRTPHSPPKWVKMRE